MKNTKILAVAAAILLTGSMTFVDVTPNSIIPSTSVSASAATYSYYTEADLYRLEKAHSKFIKKYGNSGYLSGITHNSTYENYCKEIQFSLNAISAYHGLGDTTAEDGLYGHDCKKLVKLTQKKVLKTTADGYVGPTTYNLMLKELKKIISQNEAVVNDDETAINPIADAKDIFIQQTPSHCTAAAAAMLLKNYSRINGTSDWKTITERTLRTGSASPSDSWQYGLNCNITFNRPGKSYNGIKMKAYSLTGSVAKKKQNIAKILESHPEGVVLYGTVGGNHAVYMSAEMKILDPYYTTAKYRNLSESASGCSDSFSDITQYWVIIH